MSDAINIAKLREEVNPVFSTAHSCLQIVAGTGDEDSENLRKVLGFTEFLADSKERGPQMPEEAKKLLLYLMPVFSSMVEARFFSLNNFITKNGVKNVVDLPSGYTSRGIKLAKSGIRYFGFDLPGVIDSMKSAVEKVIGENENVKYHEVDATNYASLKNGLGDVEGELHITTEGLLMYLTQSEIETVFANIRKLLLEYGGRWVTVDNELDIAQEKAIKLLTASMPKEASGAVANMAAGATAKTTLENNAFFDKDREKAKKFVEDMGFDLEFVPFKDYLPQTIKSFANYPDNIKEELIKGLQEVKIWVMTPKAGAAEDFSVNDENFNANVRLDGDKLSVELAGRLDTITAPDLLALFKEAEVKGKIEKITVDMKKLDYISSAGLRVLLIMRKSLSGNEGINIINMSDGVKEIIETTGFDTIFA